MVVKKNYPKENAAYGREYAKYFGTKDVNELRNLFQAEGYNYNNFPLLKNYAITDANLKQCKDFIERNFKSGSNKSSALSIMRQLTEVEHESGKISGTRGNIKRKLH